MVSKIIVTLLLVVAANWAVAADQININTADVQTLATELKGVGEKKAQAIVDYRTEHGPFNSTADLAAVKGIGEKVLEDNVDRIVIGAE